uniref:Uncharacterized protein n=1 Tax=Panagrellus redivivus TaxID=6233 RepID=A0A7E4ZUR1_PANRE
MRRKKTKSHTVASVTLTQLHPIEASIHGAGASGHLSKHCERGPGPVRLFEAATGPVASVRASMVEEVFGTMCTQC